VVTFTHLAEIKLQLEHEKLFALSRNTVLDKLKDAVKILEAVRKVILLELSRNENFKALLKLNHKQLFGNIDPFKNGFDQKNARKSPNTLHKLQFCVLDVQIVSIKLEF
jgi:hypothetical protein